MRNELPVISRVQLIDEIKHAIEKKTGFAMGKIGFSEQFFLGYLPFLKTSPSGLKIKAYELSLKHHCEIQSGVFPINPEFLKEFASFYTSCLQSIDILGIFGADQEKELIENNNIKANLISYQLTEPDRSIPSKDEECYLQYFSNKKLLYISPFAELLKERSNKEVYESVWKNIQKKWFYPESVQAIEIPYSYGNSKSTHEMYGTSLNLYHRICEELDKYEFDIVLLGVGALGLPLSSYIKSKGKVAISLGGHLQVLFGVNGSRWKRDDFWKKHYINEEWIEMPREYHPDNKDQLTDVGAYW
jgi:hypothetical protein